MDLCTKEINRLVRHEKFVGAFPCNSIPNGLRPPFAIIINTDRDDQPGSHWIAINVTNNGHGEYFDSFGWPPMVEDVSKFLQDLDCCFCYNTSMIQHVGSVCCGHFAVGFVLSRLSGIGFEEYISNFVTDKLKFNDFIVIEYNSKFLRKKYKKYYKNRAKLLKFDHLKCF